MVAGSRRKPYEVQAPGVGLEMRDSIRNLVGSEELPAGVTQGREVRGRVVNSLRRRHGEGSVRARRRPGVDEEGQSWL